MANGIDLSSVFNQGGFGQSTAGWQSPTNPQGVPVDTPWWQNSNLLASILGQTAGALDPEGTVGAKQIGEVFGGMGQAGLMEMSRKKKADENRQMMQYMISLLGDGGFTPADQAGPTKLTAGADKMTLDVTPERAISSDELAGSGFNAATPARNVSGFDVPTADTRVSDMQNILPF